MVVFTSVSIGGGLALVPADTRGRGLGSERADNGGGGSHVSIAGAPDGEMPSDAFEFAILILTVSVCVA